jgi:hypothetical protein
MLREPLADLKSRPSLSLVVELDSDPRLERLEAPGQVTGHVHGAVEQLSVDDFRKVEVDVHTNAGIGWKDLRPSLVAEGRTSKSISSRGSELPIGPHHVARWSGSVNSW